MLKSLRDFAVSVVFLAIAVLTAPHMWYSGPRQPTFSGICCATIFACAIVSFTHFFIKGVKKAKRHFHQPFYQPPNRSI